MVTYSIRLTEIIKLLELDIEPREDCWFRGISTIDQAKDNTLIFLKVIKDEYIDIILGLKGCLVFTQDKRDFSFDTVKVEGVRLAMAKVLNYINKKLTSYINNISPKATVSQNAKIGESVIIEDFVFIDSDVVIGDYTVIKQGAKILRNTEIGKNCIIRENSVVGGQGFGVEKDEKGNNLKISHLGGVRIFDNVEIGALNTVVSGTINPTVIEDHVKTDDHVHIAHNCHIKRNSIITAGVILSGSVTIGENVWIGPNSTIKNSLSVDEGNFIGIGTVITKNIEGKNNTYAGVPGKEFCELKNEKRAISFLVNNIEEIKRKFL